MLFTCHGVKGGYFTPSPALCPVSGATPPGIHYSVRRRAAWCAVHGTATAPHSVVERLYSVQITPEIP